MNLQESLDILRDNSDNQIIDEQTELEGHIHIHNTHRDDD